MLWVGAYLALGGKFSAGMLMAYVAYASQFTSRASSLVDYVVQLKLLRLQSERLADIALTPPEAHTEGDRIGPPPEASIRFDSVSFRYGASEPFVLRQCSFEIARGEAVAITGPSGCGKTTLVRVMIGLLDAQQGDISIGGINLKQLGKRAWRGMVGAVLQDDTLFAGSIADNISFYDEAATQDSIEAAAKLARIHDDIIAMPMGYHTLVGDMGSALSGGQKQRLFIARALYKRPKVLILDEATNHLDAECERKINETLRNMDVTRVLVAHRRETIKQADRVMVCWKGQVRVVNPRSSGTHAGNDDQDCGSTINISEHLAQRGSGESYIGIATG